MDIASLIGIFLGLFAVVGGAVLEGLHLGSITQPTAAIIVFGGTIGATMLSFPLKSVLAAAKGLMQVYRDPQTGKLVLKDQCTWEEEAKGELKTVFKDGKLVVDWKLEEIRNRVKSNLKD